MLYTKGEFRGKDVTVMISISDNGLTTSLVYIDDQGVLQAEESVLEQIITNGEVIL